MANNQEGSQTSVQANKPGSLPLMDNGIQPANTSNAKPRQQSKKTIRFSRKFLLLPAIIIIFALGGFVGLYFQPPGLQFIMSALNLSPGGGSSHPIATPIAANSNADTEQGQSATNNTVTALGTLLPLQEVSILASPFGASDARIAQLHVEEGDWVERGQVIATMDNLAKHKALVQSAQADVQVAQAQLEQVTSLVVNNQRQALAEVERIEANYAQVANDLNRGKELRSTGVITQAELDKLVSSESATRRSLEGAQANLAKFNYKDINEQIDVKLAKSTLLAAKSKLNTQQQDLASATLKAPSDGVIISIHARVGERPSTSGIVSFGNTKQMQAKLEVYQSDIQYLQLGLPVSMQSEALGSDILHGTISRIGLEVKQQQLIAKAPASNTDARVLIVNVALDPSSTLKAANLNGLEIIATISGHSD